MIDKEITNIYNLNIKGNYRVNSVKLKFIDSETKQTLLQKTLNSGTQYRLSVMETSFDGTDYIPIIRKSDGYYYGPVGFIIDDGETSPKGDKKWIFDRVINEDTTIEVEMLKFDYYFTSSTSFEKEISNMLTTHNNDLSQICIGFNDSYSSRLNYSTAFKSSSIIKTPKIIYNRFTSELRQLFESCVNLTNISSTIFDYIPKIVAFSGTFRGCSSLTSIPSKLFDNHINVTSFGSTFKNCSSLTSIPENLFVNSIEVTNVGSIFENCILLKEIPNNLFKNCTKITSFEKSFYECSALESIPSHIFDYCLKVTTFDSTFSYCSSLTSIPENLFDNNILVKNFSYTFYECKSLKIIPDRLFSKCINAYSFYATFKNCSLLETIPENLFYNCTGVGSYSDVFAVCTSLKYVPFNLFISSKNVTSVLSAFEKCSNITSDIPDAWNKSKYPNITHYTRYAYQCTKASNYNDIPDDWKN